MASLLRDEPSLCPIPLCTIPEDYKAVFGGVQAEANTLTAAHTQGNPNWITFCAGIWFYLRHSVHVWFEPTNRANILGNADFLENLIHHTPKRLLAHDLLKTITLKPMLHSQSLSEMP
ncbi:transcriptional regulator family: Fungal Specific TF, partial [Penicillium longicatenatum]